MHTKRSYVIASRYDMKRLIHIVISSLFISMILSCDNNTDVYLIEIDDISMSKKITISPHKHNYSVRLDIKSITNCQSYFKIKNGLNSESTFYKEIEIPNKVDTSYLLDWYNTTFEGVYVPSDSCYEGNVAIKLSFFHAEVE